MGGRTLCGKLVSKQLDFLLHLDYTPFQLQVGPEESPGILAAIRNA